MNDKFDELTKGMAQSVTRRQALRRFGTGLAGMLLALFGIGETAGADPGTHCKTYADCPGLGWACCGGKCVNIDFDSHNCGGCGNHCPGGKYWVCTYGSCFYNY